MLSLECARAGDQLQQQQTFAVAPLPGEEARFQLAGRDVRGVECLGGDNTTGVLRSVLRQEGQTCSQQMGGYWRWSNKTGKEKQANVTINYYTMTSYIVQIHCIIFSHSTSTFAVLLL